MKPCPSIRTAPLETAGVSPAQPFLLSEANNPAELACPEPLLRRRDACQEFFSDFYFLGGAC